MTEQAVGSRFLGEHPVFHLKGEELARERLLEAGAVAALYEHLLGGKVGEQLIYIVNRPLGSEKLAGADVEQRHASSFLAKVHGGEEVVLLAVEQGVAHHHAGGDELGDAALNELLGELWVLELVADGHALAGSHQLGQVGVEGVVRKPRHLQVLAASAVRASREGDAQDFAGHDGVVAVGLIEVAHTI